MTDPLKPMLPPVAHPALDAGGRLAQPFRRGLERIMATAVQALKTANSAAGHAATFDKTVPPGMNTGATGKLKFAENEDAAGDLEDGSVKIVGGKLNVPQVGRIVVTQTVLQTPLKTGGLFGVYWMVLGQANASTRFAGWTSPDDGPIFMAGYDWDLDTWTAYDANGNHTDFDPDPTDCIVGRVQRKTGTGIDKLHSMVGHNSRSAPTVQGANPGVTQFAGRNVVHVDEPADIDYSFAWVYRNTVNVFPGAGGRIGRMRGTKFPDDNGVSGTTYYYWLGFVDTSEEANETSPLACGSAQFRGTRAGTDTESSAGALLGDADLITVQGYAKGGAMDASNVTTNTSSSSYRTQAATFGAGFERSEKKQASTIGVTSSETYGRLLTSVPGTSTTDGRIKQQFHSDDGSVWNRNATPSDSAWNAWRLVRDATNTASLADVNSTEGTKLSGIATGATVGATAGTNLKDSGGNTLGDADVDNAKAQDIRGFSRNPTFQRWTGTLAPDNWSYVGTPIITKNTSSPRYGAWSAEISTSAVDDQYMFTLAAELRVPAGADDYYAIEYEVELVSGSFNRAGFWWRVNYQDTSNFKAFALQLNVEHPSPTAGKIYAGAKVIAASVTGSPTGLPGSATLYIMANQSVMSGTVSAKDFKIHRLVVRKATRQEIRAEKAIDDNGNVDFAKVNGGTKPSDNATVGTTIGVDLKDVDGASVLQRRDVHNSSATYAPRKRWQFKNSLQGWTLGNGTSSLSALYVTITGNAANQLTLQIGSGLSLVGVDTYKVRIRLRPKQTLTAGQWSGRCMWANAGHGFVSASYRNTLALPAAWAVDEWRTLEHDLTAPTVGGTDFIANTNTGLLVDFTNASGLAFDVAWIAVGDDGADSADLKGIADGATVGANFGGTTGSGRNVTGLPTALTDYDGGSLLKRDNINNVRGKVAGSTWTGYRAVYVTGATGVDRVDMTAAGALAQNRKLLGVAAPATSGGAVDVTVEGPVTITGAGFSVGPVYCASDGTLTQTIPTGTPWVRTVGFATSSTALWVYPAPEIMGENYGVSPMYGGVRYHTKTMLAARNTPLSQQAPYRTRALDDLIWKLDETGILSRCDFIWLLAGNDSASSRTNLANPGLGDLTAGTGITFTQDMGWAGIASAAMDSGVNLTTLANYARNDASASVFDLHNTTSSTGWFNVGDSSSFCLDIWPKSAINAFECCLNSNTSSVVLASGITSSIGHWGINRHISSQVDGWQNGVKVAAGVAKSSNGVPNVNMQLYPRGLAQMGFVHVGGGLTDVQWPQLYAAVRTYLLSLPWMTVSI